MIGDNVFVERFRAASGGLLPTTLIASWEQVVGWCEEGFYDDEEPDEYFNDISARRWAGSGSGWQPSTPASRRPVGLCQVQGDVGVVARVDARWAAYVDPAVGRTVAGAA